MSENTVNILIGMYATSVIIGALVVIFNKDAHGWSWKLACIFLAGWFLDRVYQMFQGLFGKKHTLSLAQFTLYAALIIFFFPWSLIVWWFMARRKAAPDPQQQAPQPQPVHQP